MTSPPSPRGAHHKHQTTAILSGGAESTAGVRSISWANGPSLPLAPSTSTVELISAAGPVLHRGCPPRIYQQRHKHQMASRISSWPANRQTSNGGQHVGDARPVSPRNCRALLLEARTAQRVTCDAVTSRPRRSIVGRVPVNIFVWGPSVPPPDRGADDRDEPCTTVNHAPRPSSQLSHTHRQQIVGEQERDCPSSATGAYPPRTGHRQPPQHRAP